MWFRTDKAVAFGLTMKMGFNGGCISGAGSSFYLQFEAGKKLSRWPGDTKDCSLLFLELVKMEPHAASLAELQTSPTKSVTCSRGARNLVWSSRKCKEHYHYIHGSLTQRWGLAWDRMGSWCQKTAVRQRTPWRDSRDGSIWNPRLQNNDKLPTDGVSHGSGVWVKHLQTHGQGPALLGWAGRRRSQPRWPRRSPGETPAVTRSTPESWHSL